MQTYVVRRTDIAASAAELDAAFIRLRRFEETPQTLQAQWLHSYALREPDGHFGLACLFEADSAAALQQHAALCQLPAQEILPVAGTQIVRAFAPTRVYLVRRRKAWPTLAALEHSSTVSRRLCDEDMCRQVSWLHTYAVREDDGSLGAVCLYQGIDPHVLSLHGARADMPANEISPVIGRIVFREPTSGTPGRIGLSSLPSPHLPQE